MNGLRFGSPAARLLGCLFLVFFVIGVVLALLGFDLAEVDRWLDARGGWIETIGIILFRGFWALVFLVCMGIIVTAPFMRDDPDRLGYGCLLGLAIVAWFAWFGMTG